MRVIFYVLECTEYDFLVKVKPPNIMSIGDVHPAWSWGRTTRASVGALLGGILPECIYKGCWHNKVKEKLVNPFFLTDLKREGIPTYLFIANGWFIEFLKPFMPSWLWKEMIRQNKEGFDDKWNVEKALELSEKHDNYFIYLHIMTCHPPFFEGNDPDLPKLEGFDNVRRRALLYADELLKPLLKLDVDLLLVTSDHHILHDYWHPRAYDVFVAMKGRWVEEVKGK